MAIITVSRREFINLLGKELSRDDIERLLLRIKCELDEWEEDYMKVEIKDFYRIDLLSLPGIIREIKGILGLEEGLPKYKVEFSGKEVIVDKEISKIRPYIACAVVEDVDLNEERLKDIIQMQDKIMLSFGNRRRKVAIGTHNADLITFPIHYKAVDPNEVKFVPLFEEKEMYLSEILKVTRTGKIYGHLLREFDKYPILLDSKGKVISFPPIINSNDIGRLNESTKNIFIDVTGTNLRSVLLALNALVVSLADYGGKIKSLKVIYPDKEIITPVLRVIEKEFMLSNIIKCIGMKLSKEEIKELLKRKRMDSYFKDERLVVRYLNYRNDINSEQDIAEELIIAYGLDKIKPKPLSIYTKGSLTKRRKAINLFRKIMVALGCVELYTTVLVNEDINKLFRKEGIIKIKNPISENYNTIRVSLFSSIFQILRGNRSISLPAKLFEVGRVAYCEGDKIREEDRLAFLYISSEVSFSDALSVLERLFKEINLKFELRESFHKFLIEGRQADIYSDGSEVIGWIGELNPEIIEKANVKYPIVGFEINVGKLLNNISI